jgi:hypothetical protein
VISSASLWDQNSPGFDPGERSPSTETHPSDFFCGCCVTGREQVIDLTRVRKALQIGMEDPHDAVYHCQLKNKWCEDENL